MSPSPFMVEWIERLAPSHGSRSRALDVAMGRGRHAVVLARSGFLTFGVDIELEAVRDAVRSAKAAGRTIHAWCADLTRFPLPQARFDIVVVARYLQRDLFPALQDAVVPGGVVLYETFTTAQRALGTGPTSPDHLLEPGELAGRFAAFDVLFYGEVVEPEAVARIVARRRISQGSVMAEG
jgi:2-polyprenyl-3-methyl-5-hydroxy-6-metoxy-1,4-benzoquinol methylase